jgi:hypothetical protein
MAAAQAKIEVRSFERRKPARRPLPEHLPRERIVYPALAACPCCGGALHKIGEDVTESGRTGLSMRVPIRVALRRERGIGLSQKSAWRGAYVPKQS